MFDDDIEGKGLAGKLSPRREYLNLAAVPRFSRPSMELQVPTASAHIWTSPLLCLGCGVLGLTGGGVSAPTDWETAVLLLSIMGLPVN